MFGHRSDGRKIKNVEPVFKLIPCIMLNRDDSQVFFKEKIVLNGMDAYINKKAEEGIKISYMNIVYAALVRIIAERPQLNRFAINGAIYARNNIQISLAIKKSLTDEGEETNLKITFKGTENIFEVKEVLEKEIEVNKKVTEQNGTDKLVKLFNLLPTWLVRGLVRFLMFTDKHGFMPKKIIELSPFHTSAYLTNVGSLGIDAIYHHIYNFGTTSLFLSMGKKKKSYVYEDDEIREEKCITIGFVGDERICDGYYYAASFRQLAKYLKNPELLEAHGEPKEDVK